VIAPGRKLTIWGGSSGFASTPGETVAALGVILSAAKTNPPSVARALART
jgi:hypothetical protein